MGEIRLVKEENFKYQSKFIKITISIYAVFTLFLIAFMLLTGFKSGFKNGLTVFLIFVGVSAGAAIFIWFLRKFRFIKNIFSIILIGFFILFAYSIGGIKGVGIILAFFIVLCLLIELFSSGPILFNKSYKNAMKAYDNGDFTTAINNLELFIKNNKLHDNQFCIILFLVQLYRFYNQYDKAMTIISEYAGKYHEETFQITLAFIETTILLDQNLLSESEEALNRCKEKIDNINENYNKEILLAKYNLILSKILAAKKETNKAFEILDTIPIKMIQEDYYLINGFVYEQLNNYDEAAKCYNEGLAKSNDPLLKAIFCKALTKLQQDNQN